MKPRIRLHFHLFDGKTPLWWATRLVIGPNFLMYSRTTGGYVDPSSAIREAARL